MRRPAVLEQERWTALARGHAARADALTAGHRDRAARGETHPVEDFLFTYYDAGPNVLRRWHPGAGVVLTGDASRERLGWAGYREAGADGAPGPDKAGPGPGPGAGPGAEVDVPALLGRRHGEARRLAALLRATAGRPLRLSCFGLHEWAMVHRRPADRRHGAVPLRLGAQGTDAVVERLGLACTHFDAYRFFTPTAAPLNPVALRRDTQVEHEQPGCLHATMDLYRAAYRLGPLVPGPLLLDAFELAGRARVLDMRASPYDLAGYGYAPVRVETAAGRAEYVRAQRTLAQEGAGIRRRLLDVLDAAGA